MAYRGLLQKFDTLRPLDQAERMYQLRQRVRLSVTPQDRLSVINMHANTLEIVDKWFAWKGALSILLICIIGALAAIYAAFVYFAATRPAGAMHDDATTLIFCGVLIFPFVAVLMWLLKKESFAYTHYPIRFDRIQRQVHVFRPNGTVLTAPWDKIFFTLGQLNQRMEWEVRGHLLAADGKTVMDTFALSHASHIGDLRIAPGQIEFSDSVRAHWEFVRRFMEDGPEAVAHVVQQTLPVAARRETARESMRRIFANNAHSPAWVTWLMFIPSVLSTAGRIFAMRTSKIPRWPAEIEKDAQIAVSKQ